MSSHGVQDNLVTEGLATINLGEKVFYNKVQEFNRDLTILCLNVFTADNTSNFQMFEGLSATGLRCVRAALEVQNIEFMVANDINKEACNLIQENIVRNSVSEKVSVSCLDCNTALHCSTKPFQIIDLDPFGSAAPFLDTAVQRIADNGLLCVTCTDVAILCGNSPETCFAKYGAMSFRGPICHEMALRIILQSINSHAARHGKHITPLLSVSVDFYVRLFVQVSVSKRLAKEHVNRISHVLHCPNCHSWDFQPLTSKVPTSSNTFKFVLPKFSSSNNSCPNCLSNWSLAGPVWNQPIHNQNFVNSCQQWLTEHPSQFKNTRKRVEGLLSLVAEELPDQPFFYSIPDLCKIVHCTSPPLLSFRSALLNCGYETSLSHCCESSLKTNAPSAIIWAIMRAWVKDHPITEKWQSDRIAISLLMATSTDLKIDFSPHPDANPISRMLRLNRYPRNPEPNWGPGRLPQKRPKT